MPGPTTHRLVDKQDGVITVTVPRHASFVFESVFITKVLNRLSETFDRHHVLPFLTLARLRSARSLRHLLHSSDTSKIIILDFRCSQRLTRIFRSFSGPAMFVNHPFPHVECPCISISGRKTTCYTTRLLIRENHEGVNVVTKPSSVITPGRHAVKYIGNLTSRKVGPLTIVSKRCATRRNFRTYREVLRRCPRISNIFTRSSRVTINILRTLTGRKERIPGSMSIVKFSSFPITAVTGPGLAAFTRPLRSVTRTVTRVLY